MTQNYAPGQVLTAAAVNAELAFPTGSVIPYAGASAPSATLNGVVGWLLADGSAVSRTTYATLFGIVGTTYGAGDGSTTFNLPDLRGRTAVGAESDGTAANNVSRTRGTKFGDTRLQSHTHTGTTGFMNSNNLHSPFVVSPGGHSWGANFGGLSGGATFTFSPSGVFAGVYGGQNLRTEQFDVNHQHNITTNDHNQNIGTGANSPPSLVLNYLIKT